jgi:hypothetical protein
MLGVSAHSAPERARTATIPSPEPFAPKPRDRDDDARLLDTHLRRLARQEALCRRVLGRLARSLLQRHGHHKLGFARLGDYARERLGLSAREVQELARVADGLDGLPEIARAFEQGSLSWTHVRLLVTVATAETEARWLATARGCTVRRLEAIITGGTLDSDGAIDGEPRVRFWLRCPRRVRALWREAAELASRMSGEELPVWRAAEAIGAEGLSSAAALEVPEPPRAHSSPAEGEPVVWAAVDAAVPADVEALLLGADYLSPFVLDGRLRAALRAMQRIDFQTGHLLRLVADRRLYRWLGFASLAVYVRERLGISTRKGRALVALERKGARAPALAEAYREGRISWLRALTILPVAGEAWVTRAQEVTVRRLVAEVEWALDAEEPGPPPAGSRLTRMPARQMRAHDVDAEVTFMGPASVIGLLRVAVAAFRGPAEPSWRGLEKLLLHVTTEWERQPRHPDPVFARDGWRCAVPACSSRRNLHDHHIVFRSQGGGNERDNRVSVCAWHHLRGLHAGRVRAWGRAPHDVTWEVGVGLGHPPLFRARGDYYVR